MKLKKNLITLGVIAIVALHSGCATYRTISEAEEGTAKVFSGTRLDLKAINGERLPTRQFKSDPPASPRVDLPFSLALDLFLLPLTSMAVLYEAVFY